jgi:hypothetical protein
MTKKIVSYVVSVIEDKVYFDGDGSREWIRRLFDIETNTFDTQNGEYVKDDVLEARALKVLEQHGVIVSDDSKNWQER